jgi:hypothetical protein
MIKPERKTAVVILKVEPTVKLQMENRADRLGLTLSEFIRQCYTDWMDTCSQEAIEAKAMRAYENS